MDVIVQNGNLIASISSTTEMIELNYIMLGVSSEIGLSHNSYNFQVENKGQKSCSGSYSQSGGSCSIDSSHIKTTYKYTCS